MSDKQPKTAKANQPPKKPYSPPMLKVYGGIKQMTASGTGTQQENQGQPGPDRKP